MICKFIFYLDFWGSQHTIHTMDGSNLCPANVGEIIIIYYRNKPQHFVVKERIIDYTGHIIHYKVEKVSEVDVKD